MAKKKKKKPDTGEQVKAFGTKAKKQFEQGKKGDPIKDKDKSIEK